MFDQAFSASNFRRIFDLGNRKGRYLEKLFFPRVVELTTNAKDLAREIRDCRSKLAAQGVPAETSPELTRLYERRKSLRAQKEAELTKAREEVSCEAAADHFKIGIRQGGECRGKVVYVDDGTAATFFCIKQIQRNINALYKVRQSNRYFIVSQMREFLSDKFPKYVLRTDISDSVTFDL